MSNNKQSIDLTASLPLVTGGAVILSLSAGMEDRVGQVNALKVAAVPQNLVQSAEASTATPTINNQPDVTTQDQSHSDERNIGILLDLAKSGRNRANERKPSICKVSRILRDLSISSFDPQLVSIGPIHRHDPKLQEFELLKECYLDDLLHRRHNSTPEKTLKACLRKVNNLMVDIKKSYGGMIKDYCDADLARMMVMDGCFILEFCFKHEDEDSDLPNKMHSSCIAMDLMLLENQVPFVVLQALFHCTMGKRSFTLSNVLDKYLAPYSRLFRPAENSTTNVDSDLPKKSSTTHVDSNSTHDHVLGYLHKRYQLVAAKSSKPKDELKLVDEKGLENRYTLFHSIVELDRSGVNFKPGKDCNRSLTIKFQPSLFACLPWLRIKPTLLMPTLEIDDTTELILRNFIAYEQSFPKDRYYFTSYAHAMDMLIDSQEDIAKLVDSKVLVNTLGSNQKAAEMINNICKNMVVTDFCYTEEFKEIDGYYNGYWPKNIAWLRRVYFNNPWNAIALLAAIILFSLTVVQTYYTIMGK